MEIRYFNGKLDWQSLVGKWVKLDDRSVVATAYDETDCSLYVGEFFPNNIGQTTKVALLDVENGMKILSILGYDLTIVDGVTFSNETTNKAQGLVLAGFSKLIKQDMNYSVDGIFQQTILSQEELEYLLNEGIEELLLSDIK